MGRTGWLLDLDRGLTPYAEAWALQKLLVAARQRGAISDGLILLEHEPVFTIGRSTKAEHLLFPREALRAQGFGVYEIERGGSITYHGPSQLVGYPILDLRGYGEDIVGFMRSLEETLLRTLADFGIAAGRLPGYPGVWVGGEKIASVGVAVKRRVTMHGFALNVDPDLGHFALINPCGLGKPVTSMARLLGRPVAMADVRAAYARRFAEVYDLALEPVTVEALRARAAVEPAGAVGAGSPP
ncbi:MAG: lipoyl(octanoyl) transferase LipB [Armatimonadota bacterium]|nr:lipoyl(octanoyl) transferase LipB [Armatimonadota bacterium]MDR7467615.1 lipoyl(octanoyl) transferase LipB [Armatimonadota bacterium]MDR7494424.1 lipoyl(octanoyl) transferase LipB [Armatimonadota bacterium]MDR7500404.1 lipoyl(octanoyl) transferase LipB [Armatimonadota bacterium]MDR7505030.1 lipoyl(octanoyl) transferase LipB [Armatimonadota bacterium]